MANFVYKTFSLDIETCKILEQLPRQSQSSTIRDLIRTLKHKPLEEKIKKDQLMKLLRGSQEKQPAAEETYEKRETRLLQAARTVQKRRKRNSKGLKEDIAKLFEQATG